MGLDMYLHAVKDEFNSEIDFEIPEHLRRIEIAYWRKQNALHNWMRSLYEEKGGTEEFNCTNLKLTKKDLERLNKDIKQRKLVPTAGFFFGSTDYSKSDWKNLESSINEAVRNAKTYIKDGYSIVYYAWY